MSVRLSLPVLLTALAAALLPGASPGQDGPPVLAVGKVTVKGGNRIRGVEDGVIFTRRFGDDCAAFDSFPAAKAVAASLGQEVAFEVEIISCHPLPSLPEIRCRSHIESGGGSESAWVQARGARLVVPVRLPGSTGVHVLRLECRIGEATAELATTLYLTYASPRPMVDPPDPDWYRRACEWGAGLTRAAGEQAVADRILDGLFYFGQRRWRYGLCAIEGETCVLGSTRVSTAGLRCNCTYGICKLDWTELARAEGERNFSDCYQFSSAFEYIAATMGIGGMVEVEELGREKLGFQTRPTTRSLDPAFAGNLTCGRRNLACAFTFYNHDLRQRGGRIYDATFGNVYGSASELVFESVTERAGEMLAFDQDAALRTGIGYGNFTSWRELAPGECRTCPAAGAGRARFGEDVRMQTISLDRSPEPEALAVDFEVVIEQEGSYSVYGAILCKDGRTTVTLRPERRLQDVLSEARISGRPGRSWARLIFSGEDLERARSCAPYRLHADLVAEGRNLDHLDTEVPVDTAVLASLSEGAGSLGTARDLRLAWVVVEGSGLALRATLPMSINIPGAFAVEARLARGEETLAYGGYRREMSRDTDLLEVDFPFAALPPKGRCQIAISLHWLDPLSPVDSLLVEDVELPPAP